MYNCIYSIYNVYCTKQNIVTYVNQELERFLGIYEELVWHKEGQMLLFASLPFVGQLLTIILQMISMLVNTEFSETGDRVMLSIHKELNPIKEQRRSPERWPRGALAPCSSPPLFPSKASVLL